MHLLSSSSNCRGAPLFPTLEQENGENQTSVLTCTLQRLLQAPLRLSELLQNLKILLHGVSIAQAHTQQNTHAYTRCNPS